MIRVSAETARLAFDAFCTRRRKWVASIGAPAAEGGQLKMYRAAARAFGNAGQLEDFLVVYNGLRKWKLSRGALVLTAEAVFEKLSGLEQDLRRRSLSGLGPGDWPGVWDALCQVKDVKPLKHGDVSVMAVSKFLHFWNPRLFVICDQQEVEGFVFGHQWLKDQRAGMGAVHCVPDAKTGAEPRLAEYLDVLAFTSRFVKFNPHILLEFARTVRSLAGEATVPDDIETYEATAVEWCLVGLVELPPDGVTFS